MKSHKNSSYLRVAIGSLVLAALSTIQATAADYTKDNKDATDLKHKDTVFIKNAAEGGLAEVELGQLAAQKAQNDQVKQLGQRIQADHSKANQEVQQIAQKLGVTVPTELARRHRKLVEDMQSKSGADFDKAFTEHAIKDHKKDIKEFERAVRDAENPDVKSFAQRTLPTLREHLRLAQDAGRAVGLTGSLLTTADEDKSGIGRSASEKDSSTKEK